MSNSAQYAITPKMGFGAVTTGDTSRTAPTAGNVAYVYPSGASGSRIDHINFEGIGTTTASMIRLFLVPGFVGPAISSITFVGTTATVTTSQNHGLSNGALVTIQFVTPFNYNVTNVAITVTGLNTFTYTMASTPTISAVVVPSFFIYTTATPTYQLWQEVTLTAVTPSSTIQVFSAGGLSSSSNQGIMPLWLPAGYSLRATVNDTQTASGVNVFANGGDF